jgi:arylsulfatase A-like enzyme
MWARPLSILRRTNRQTGASAASIACSHLDDHVVGGKLEKGGDKFFNDSQMKHLRGRQLDAVKYLDGVVEELFDIVPKNTYITITSDHGELFGESGFFGHGPIFHRKVFEVPFVEGLLR